MKHHGQKIMDDRQHEPILKAAIMRELKIARSNKCAFCSNMAELYCDYIIGSSAWVFYSGQRRIYLNVPPERCDAPICTDCGTNGGIIFYCGKDGSIETKDYCPVHTNIGTMSNISKLMSIGKAESIRLKQWKMKYFQQ